jgi:hypothetical protein
VLKKIHRNLPLFCLLRIPGQRIDMPRPLLLLLGDSITELGSDWRRDGWICLLLDRYSRSADIAQRGMGGYTTQ